MLRQDVLLLAFFAYFALVLFAALAQCIRVFWQDRAHLWQQGELKSTPLQLPTRPTKFAGRPSSYVRRVKAAWGPIRKDGLYGRPAIQPPFDHAACERTYIDLAKESR